MNIEPRRLLCGMKTVSIFLLTLFVISPYGWNAISAHSFRTYWFSISHQTHFLVFDYFCRCIRQFDGLLEGGLHTCILCVWTCLCIKGAVRRRTHRKWRNGNRKFTQESRITWSSAKNLNCQFQISFIVLICVVIFA